VSLRDIASAADVHVTLITRYFGSRDSLIRAVFDDLAASIAEHTSSHPLEQHSFDPESSLGRWMAILAHWMITGQDPRLALGGINPVQAMANVIVEHNGLPDRDARIRAAQIFGSALGWRLFEPYLITAGSLQDEDPADLHDSLTAMHRQVGATAVESGIRQVPQQAPEERGNVNYRAPKA
jgi:AcrR family transcriptional regulator